MTKKIACLFDWDGVIVDSSAQHKESWELLAAEEKLYLPDDHFLKGFGMRNEIIIPELYKWTEDPQRIRNLSDRKEELYRQLIRENGIEALPGVEPFLTMLHGAGVPCVVGSSTPLKNIETVADMLGFRRFFTDYVASEDVSRGKPDPEVFLLAAQKAGQVPERSIVFEDALMGVEAGKGGGMKVVAVTTTNPREKLKEADKVVDRLDELSLHELEDLLKK